MYGSSTSLMSQSNTHMPMKPAEINKFNIRTKIPQFSVQIPFLNNEEKNVYIETFTVMDVSQRGIFAGDQFYLYCDNAKGFYRANGKQTLLCAIANWDGDSNKLIFSMLNNNPFQIQKNDHLLNFIITKSAHTEDLYPQEQEGTQIPDNNDTFLFNIVINVLSDE